MSGEKPESAAVSVPMERAPDPEAQRLVGGWHGHESLNDVFYCTGYPQHRAQAMEITLLLDAARDEQREKDARQWQPIETAPKDGGEMLLRVKMRAGIRGKTLVGHYMPGGHCIEDHPPIAAGWYFWNGLMFDKAAEPTHWMPLPEGPR